MIYAWVKWYKNGKPLPVYKEVIIGMNTEFQERLESVMTVLGYGSSQYFLTKDFRANEMGCAVIVSELFNFGGE